MSHGIKTDCVSRQNYEHVAIQDPVGYGSALTFHRTGHVAVEQVTGKRNDPGPDSGAHEYAGGGTGFDRRGHGRFAVQKGGGARPLFTGISDLPG